MKQFKSKGFSLIELIISLVVISCITAAFVPVISKKLSSGNTIIAASPVLLPNKTEKTLERMQNIGAALELLKNCKLNNNKTKLICEVELAKTENFENNKIKDNNLKVVKQIDNDNPVSTKVKYSERRDKIRFKDKESGEYQTSTTDEITDKDVEEIMKTLSTFLIPIENNDLILDEIEAH